MASFDGLSKDKAEQILGMSVVSGSINPAGHLILVRANGDTIDAGDFTGIVTGILSTEVTSAVNVAVPNAVAGTKVDKGTTSGAITFTEFNSATLVNALVTVTLNGNASITASTAFPSSPKPNTQFAMRVQQDSAGARVMSFIGLKKSQGVLALTATPGAIDLLVFFFDGTYWYVGMMGVDLK